MARSLRARADEEARYWDNLTPYRQALLDRLRAAFDTFAPAIDAVLC